MIDQIRSFNRFYTREIGLLAKYLPGTDLSLAEGRVLYELAHADEITAASIVRALGMDKAHVSRIVARLVTRGYVKSRPSRVHAKQKLLSLTARGRKAFGQADRGSQEYVEAVLEPFSAQARAKLAMGLAAVRAAFEPVPLKSENVRLRSLRSGDVGWIVHRQAVLYHSEYGWDWTFEGLAARILGDFVMGFDPTRDDAWVAEIRDEIIGSIFLTRGDDPAVAKLRMLYVEPNARGLGLGSRLVATCIERARALGYRTLALWTNDVLTSARRIYEGAGFMLVREERHRSFGHDLNGQTWSLDLTVAPSP
jgi:DNA-binding MarR family transcriptional regulator/GNAT superfamily N-acetyltransferase